ncbi:hypothetical protein CSC06_0700 [Escherichia coli]|nr:hypothetical protein CSC06_0700 [Escherichia coli]EII10881.1 hypothetical protein EC50959_0731 [Escherichia coli 5.0959]KEN15181.1 hypothetical protein AD06_0852 [Escherichia coli 7-233-03_S4_C2]
MPDGAFTSHPARNRQQFQTLNCLMHYAYQAYMISAIY